MKVRQETTFGTVFQPWPLKPLPEVMFFQEGPGLRKWQWTESGMKVINVTNIIGDGSVDVNNTSRFISTDEFESKYRHFAVDAGDIVVASSGNTYGKVGRVNHFHLPIMMNTSVIRFHPAENEKLDQNFLYAFLRSHLFKNQMESFVIGSAQPNFGPSHLKRMVVPCPDIATQRKIGGILSAYDDLIENNTRRIAILEEMAQAIYREWFVHFRFPGHENAKFVDSPLGRIPEGWKIVSLSEITTKIGSGSTPRGGKESYTDSGISLIRSLNVYDNQFQTDQLAFLNDKQAKLLGNVAVAKHDILLNITGASVARCCMVPSYILPARVNQHVAIIRVDTQTADPFFVLSTINSDRHKRRILALAQGGATREALTKETICKYEIVLPPKAILEQYGSIIADFCGEQETLQKKNRCLRMTRDLLLPKLISGQLDVEQLDIDTDQMADANELPTENLFPRVYAPAG